MSTEKKQIQLSDHFDYGTLCRFVGPSVIMMVLSSLFNMIDDGVFISNFVGKEAFVALNIMSPIPSILGALSHMLAAGGSAHSAKLLGEKKDREASEVFSMVVLFTAGASIVLSVIVLLLLDWFCALMGAEGEVLSNCYSYAAVIFPAAIIFMLQGVFQTYLITAERPELAMRLTIASGVSNIVFDILLIIVFNMGITGAALATVSGPLIVTVVPLIYFFKAKDSNLRLIKTGIDFKCIGHICFLGLSQFFVHLSLGLVSMVFNYQLMKYSGEDGVAAYGVISYLRFVFNSAYIGYSNGISPVIAYNYGAQNIKELQNLFKKSITVIACMSVVLTALSMILASPFSKIFVSYDAELLALTVHAFHIFSFNFTFQGAGIFAGAFFTALNDGATAGLMSLLRIGVYQIGSVLILPLFFGLEGIWYAPVVASVLSFITAMILFAVNREKYRYA